LYSFNYQIERKKRKKTKTRNKKEEKENGGKWDILWAAHEQLMLMCTTGALSHFYRATLTVLFL
jgi:hypothetical protein